MCEAVSDNLLSLCTPCQQDLPWLLHCCKRCALPLENQHTDECLQCKINPPVFDAAICALHYATPVDYLVKRLKFGHQLSYAKVLGVLLAQHIAQLGTAEVDAILPVPLHKARLRKRGFNQALELAHELKTLGNIPLLKSVSRVKHTMAQTLVKGEASRAANLNDAFAIKSQITTLPRHVAIVDDVVTTGSTTNELARLLKEAGVAKVSVWAVARATPQT